MLGIGFTYLCIKSFFQALGFLVEVFCCILLLLFILIYSIFSGCSKKESSYRVNSRYSSYETSYERKARLEREEARKEAAQRAAREAAREAARAKAVLMYGETELIKAQNAKSQDESELALIKPSKEEPEALVFKSEGANEPKGTDEPKDTDEPKPKSQQKEAREILFYSEH